MEIYRYWNDKSYNFLQALMHNIPNNSYRVNETKRVQRSKIVCDTAIRHTYRMQPAYMNNEHGCNHWLQNRDYYVDEIEFYKIACQFV